MGRKKTTEQFIEELKLKRPDITVLGEYVKSNIKVEVKHSCGYQWEITPSNLFQGKSCPECYKIEASKKQTKSTQQFIEELKLKRPDITVLGEYVKSNIKVEVKHSCGYQWDTIPTSLLQGSSCPKCSKIKASNKCTKTTQQFIEELKLKRPDITVLGEYVKSNIKVEVKHSCGYQWEITPSNLFQVKSCPKCSRIKASKKRAKTTQQFIEELEIVNPEITLLGKYVGSLTKIEVKHICGYEWNSAPSSLLRGSSCPKCSRTKVSKKYTKTTKQFIKELKIINPEITVIGKYINSKTKIKIQHTCGYQWEAIPGNLLQGNSCPKCSKIKTSKKRAKTTKQFIEELKGVNSEITVIGNYINSQTKIEVKHSCGYEWEAIPIQLRQGTSCPRCNESKGEKFLSKVLTSNNIPFVTQFNLVKNPKTNYWLRSDFAILDKDKKTLLIIEYDGVQHFKPIEYFGGEEALKDTQYRDSIKDEYCKENNIPFIRFNYKQSEDYIIKVLLKQLKKLKVI